MIIINIKSLKQVNIPVISSLVFIPEEILLKDGDKPGMDVNIIPLNWFTTINERYSLFQEIAVENYSCIYLRLNFLGVILSTFFI